MKIEKGHVVYLSGTGTTEKYAKAFADALPFECDITAMRHDTNPPSEFSEHELLVLAGPVFGGFMSPFVWKWLEDVQGNGTPLVNLAVYGARDYDNALFEMEQKMREKGFVTVGAAALVARHSIAQTVAASRPDAHDLEEVEAFATTIASRLDEMGSAHDAPTFDFKHIDKEGGAAAHPLTNDACTECGTCADECPAGAIPADAPNTLVPDVCISCLRCVEVCPEGARYLPDALVEKITAMLGKVGARDDKPNEFF